MNKMDRPKERLCFLLVILLFTLPPCTIASMNESTIESVAPSVVKIGPPRKVLFIGNSFTYYNDGIDLHFKRLAASAKPPIVLDVASHTTPGANLSGHYNNLTILDAIRQEDWDVVILQGYSDEPIDRWKQKSFVKYARLLSEEIRRTEAQTVFFMTWAYQNVPNMTQRLRNAYVNIGNELEALVVPIGLAWKSALQERPTLKLYSDSKHPTLRSTYLSACVFYASLLGKSPVGLSYTAGLAKEDAMFFQRVAWETVQAFFRK
jgi:hypothetical protein